MKSFLKFSSIVLCLAAVPLFAAPPCTNIITTTVSGSLDVPAGTFYCLYGVDVMGTVTVEGTLVSFSAHFHKNVNVTGGTIQIANGNGPSSAIEGNLAITGSSGNNSIGCPSLYNLIGGNISFTQSSGNLYVCQATVLGGVTVNNNVRINNDYSGPYVAALNNITAVKNLTCDGNVSADGSAPVQGSSIKVTQKTGQCSNLQ
jgi:hypothetical protein